MNTSIPAQIVTVAFEDGGEYAFKCGLEGCECPEHETAPLPAGTYVTLRFEGDHALGLWPATLITSRPGATEGQPEILGEAADLGLKLETGDPRAHLHALCDCVPDLGPAHCHLCGNTTGTTVPWGQCTAVLSALSGQTYIPNDLTEAIEQVVGHGDYAPYVLDGQVATLTGTSDDWHDVVAVVDAEDKPAAIKFTRSPDGSITHYALTKEDSTCKP